MDSNVRSTTPLSVGVAGRAGWTEIPSERQAVTNLSEMKTRPRSTVMVSGTITGRAAACSRRASTLINRACGASEADIRRASDQPGRIGSGTSIRASSSAASTAFVPAAAMAALAFVTATLVIRVRRSDLDALAGSAAPGIG